MTSVVVVKRTMQETCLDKEIELYSEFLTVDWMNVTPRRIALSMRNAGTDPKVRMRIASIFLPF